MKPFPVLCVFIFAAGLVAGCGKSNEGSTESSPNAAAAAAPAPAGPKTYEFTAGDNMKFNLTQITAAPGEEIRVTLQNIGTQPKDAMGHNWVLLKKGADPQAYAMAAIPARATDYQPPALNDQVIARIPLLGPKQTGEVVFKAPSEPGEYTFLCSFPAHYQTGMKGVLVVK